MKISSLKKRKSTYRPVYMQQGDVQDQARTSTLVDSSGLVSGSKDILKHGKFHCFIDQAAIFKYISNYIKSV
jgi:hypothetical protein